MPDYASLERIARLILATAEQDLTAAQRLAAHAVAETMRYAGATATLGQYAGFTSAEVHGRDGRTMVIVPLYDWEPDPELGLESPGSWEYAVRDVDGNLLPRPDGDDTFGCTDIWHAGDFGLRLAEGTDQHHHMQELMADLIDWTLVLGENDRLGRVTPGQDASGYRVDPYPGQRPYGSFVIDDEGLCWPVSPDEAQPSGWAVSGDEDSVCLDEWLATFGAAPLAERIPLVGYGSNASPGKVLANGTPLPSVHLACTLEDLASVWCSGDTAAGRTPLTLDVLPGHSEEAVVMMCDLAEMRTLDARRRPQQSVVRPGAAHPGSGRARERRTPASPRGVRRGPPRAPPHATGRSIAAARRCGPGRGPRAEVTHHHRARHLGG